MPIELKNDMIYNKDIIFIDSDNATWFDNEYMKFSVDIMQPIRNAVCIKIIKCSVLLSRYPGNTVVDDDATANARLVDPNSPAIYNQNILGSDVVKINKNDVLDDDPIYIHVNNYNRVSSLLVNVDDEVVYEKYDKDVYRTDGSIEYKAGDYKLDANGGKISQVINNVKKYNILNCFEMININVSDTYKYTHMPDLSTVPSLLYTKEYPQTAFNINDANMHILDPVEKNLKRFDIELRDKNNALIEKYKDLQVDSEEYARGGMKSFKITLCVYSLKQNF